MKQSVKTVFYCEYCNKHYLHRGFANRHEEFCSKNPKNKKPCYDCKHFDSVDVEVFVDGGEHYKDDYRMSKCFHCSLKVLNFWTLSAQRKGLDKRYDNEMEYMPDKCSEFEDKYEYWNSLTENFPI